MGRERRPAQRGDPLPAARYAAYHNFLTTRVAHLMSRDPVARTDSRAGSEAAAAATRPNKRASPTPPPFFFFSGRGGGDARCCVVPMSGERGTQEARNTLYPPSARGFKKSPHSSTTATEALLRVLPSSVLRVFLDEGEDVLIGKWPLYITSGSARFPFLFF